MLTKLLKLCGHKWQVPAVMRLATEHMTYCLDGHLASPLSKQRRGRTSISQVLIKTLLAEH